MNNSSILFAILAILLVISVISPGCLQENRPGQLPATTPPTEVSHNSSVNVTSIEPTTIAITTYPSEQSGVRIFKDTDSICVGQDLNFGLINEGNSTIGFGVGNPYKIQLFVNGTWGNLYNGGGTMGYWYLNPGDRYERDLFFTPLETYYDFSNVQEFTVRPGLYRVIFVWGDLDNPTSVATEFTVKDC